MRLDFSELENIAYRGFEGAKARAEKDELIEKGFTVVEGEKTPFEAAEGQPLKLSIPPAESPAKSQLKPFTGMDTSRNYRAFYRAACDFHERNNPPRPDIDYWEKVTDDIRITSNRFNNDPFIRAMLVAVYDELEREYKTMEAKQSNKR